MVVALAAVLLALAPVGYVAWRTYDAATVLKPCRGYGSDASLAKIDSASRARLAMSRRRPSS